MLNQHKTIKDNIDRYNKEEVLIDYLFPFIEGKKKVSILDVGSGAYSTIGSYFPGIELSITHCDNQDFTLFWKKYKATPLVKIEYQDMEELTYPDNFFDIVHSMNALDHTNNAEKAVKEMIRVCMPDGFVYIECNLDQMDTGHKHKWNVKQNGTVTNGMGIFDLKNFGFKIEFIDNGGESRYNKITATLQK